MRDTKTGRYEVFPDGTILTLDGSRALSQCPDSHNYPVVCLTSSDGSSRAWNVHVLIGEAFLGPLEVGQEWRHWDDDPWNNHIENLYKGTKSQNADDRVRNGRQPNQCGENNHNAKLTDTQVLEIGQSTELGRVLAVRYGVSSSAIYRARKYCKRSSVDL